MHLFAIALAPAIALVWFLYARNAYTPPRKSLITALFVIGGGSALLALILNHTLEKYTTLWSGAPEAHLRTIFWLLGIGLNEEFAKMAVLLVLLYPRRDFTTTYQGLLGAATVALGFAAVENLFYLERYGSVTLLARSAITVPAHAFFSVPMGVLMAYAKYARTVRGKYLWLLAGLFISAGFHGMYDVWLSLEPDWMNWVAYGQVVLMGLLTLRLMRLPPVPPTGRTEGTGKGSARAAAPQAAATKAVP